jgi:glycosyltransferase involved in cell wall biosynthesis
VTAWRAVRERLSGHSRGDLKIVILAASLHRGGGCRLLVELANGLARRGRTVQVVIVAGQPVVYPLETELIEIPALDASYLPPADVAIANYYSTVAPAYAAYGRRTIRLSLGFEPLWSADWQGAAATYRLPLHTLAISTWLADLIRGASETPVVEVVHPGVDHQVFHPPDSSPDGKPPRVLYFARARSQGYAFKGGSDFLEAWTYVHERIPNAELWVTAPDGVLDDPPQSEFRLVSAPDDRDLAAAYQEASLFVSSSWFEGFGLPVLESMASGTPVVSTDSGGVRDLVQTGLTGVLVPPRSPTTLALAIERVLTDPAFARRMAHNAERAVRGWTWDAMAAEVDRHIERVSTLDA